MSEKLVLRKKNGIYVVPVNDILYLEKNLRKVCIHTQTEALGNIDVYSSFDEIMTHLDDRFMCCHRSYIFNMDKIIVLADQTVFLEGNESIYLGRDSVAKARRIFGEYLEIKLEAAQQSVK